MTILQNLILIDWLSFTSKIDDALTIINLLGFLPDSFQTVKGAKGYTYREYYDGVSIHHGDRDEVWCEMSGQGCRVFESFGSGDWNAIFDLFRSDRINYHVTRVDIAFDDHSELLDIRRVASDAQNENFISKWRWWEVRRSSQGISVYHGSPQSDARVRIYDKAAERGREDEGHWVRCELQLRDERATEFICRLAGMPLGVLFSGVLFNYLRYVVPDDSDSNNRRWATAGYWFDFIGAADKISLYVCPGIEYNFFALEKYVVAQAGAAAAAYVQLVGEDDFLKQIRQRLTTSRNPKYNDLIEKCRFILKQKI